MRSIVRWLFAIMYCSRLWAQDPTLTLEHLNHRAYRALDGVPAQVYALAQTSDGTLWMGGPAGLARFDGVRFVHYPGPSDAPLPSTGVSALIASPDGSLWIGFGFGGICQLRDTHVVAYTVHDGIPEGTVRSFSWDTKGALWIATTSGLARLRGTHIERISSDFVTTTHGLISSMLIDRADNVWVATRSRAGYTVLVRSANGFGFHVVDAKKTSSGIGIRLLTASPDGHVWFAANGSVIRLDPLNPSHNRVLRVRKGRGPLPFFDREGNAWFAYGPGIALWESSQVDADLRSRSKIAHLITVRTETGNNVLAEVFLEDRERNIWVGSALGLDRFSRSVVAQSLKPCPGNGYAIAAGDAGTLWAACDSPRSSAGQLLEIRDGRIRSRRKTLNFTAAYRDQNGTVWFGGPAGLAHLEGRSIVTSPLPKQIRGFDVQALARDAQGALWVSVIRHAVYRVKGGQWVAYGGLDAMPRGPAVTETADGRGGIWFAYPDSQIAHLREEHVEVFGRGQGLNLGNITAIHVSGGLMWAGGDFGLARFTGTGFVSITNAPGCTLSGASGIVSSENGDLWLNGNDGIAHLSRQEIARVVRNPASHAHCQVIDYLDGIPGTAVQLRPTPSAVATSDGRVWFELTAGTVSIDAAHLTRNLLAPPVTIWSVNSAGRRYLNSGVAIHLPAHTRNMQIDYSAGSYTVPERVRFRYKLEGADDDWQDGGGRREAIYTNLGPGQYRFRVTASNSDGVWNNTGAMIDLAIAPMFYQTKWFYSLCALVALAILAILYRMRMEQVRRQTGRLLEARLAERERIARELHDTLLQGTQGLIWRFQAVTDRIAPDAPERALMEESLERADEVLGEGRNRVKDLRAIGSDGNDLEQVLALEGQQLAATGPVEFRTSLEGTRRALQPIVHEEAFFLAREALVNAFRHAGAKHIEVEVSYGKSALRVRVRDDGQGISAEVLAGGKPNRFGLIGMRERATKLGSQLQIWSRPGAGTEIDLRIPARLAYRTPRPKWWRR